MGITKEQAKAKADEIKDILAPMLKIRLSEELLVIEVSDGDPLKYYRVTWLALKRRTFAAVNMKGYLTIHKSPNDKRIPVTYGQHLENLSDSGFEINADVHGAVNNRYIQWDTQRLKEFVHLQFDTQGM